MKKILFVVLTCLTAQLTQAQTPKWAEKAKKAVFSVIAYDQENKIKGNGNGFYIGNGVALSDFGLFDGCDHAVIINADGKQLPIQRIGGANSMYDVIKLCVEPDNKQTVLNPGAVAKEGETVYLLPYSTQKATTLTTGKVTKVDKIGEKSLYYTLEMSVNEKNVSCPIVNANGELLGMIQKSASDSQEAYAIGATYGEQLNISALSVNESALMRTNIPKALPAEEQDALIYLSMVASSMDREQYGLALNDLLTQHPNSSEGYLRRAYFYMTFMDAEHNDLANADINKALAVSTDIVDTKYNLAKALNGYNQSLQENEEPYSEWTYDKALGYITDVVQADKQGIYLQLKGNIEFAMQKYDDAYNSFMAVNETPMASATMWFYAARCKEFSEADPNEVLALLDSAIVRTQKPLTSETSAFYYERAQVKVQLKKYREAVLDYNEFYEGVRGQVSALFYLQREQAEINTRMYKQALDDILKAEELAPEDIDVLTEKAALHIRINQLNEAVTTLNKLISIDDKLGGAYRMLGYCQAQLGKKKEAAANLKKALDLGDESAQSVIDKYLK